MTVRRPVLIYDGDCGFCTRTATWVKRLDVHNRFEVLPSQTPGLLAQSGLTEQQAMEAAWYVAADGRLHRGADAVNAAFFVLGGIYRVASWFYRVPGLRQLEDVAYAWIARNRYRMPGSTDACKIPAQTPQVDR